MVNRRLKVVAIVTVFIVVIAGFVYVSLPQNAMPETAAQAMILKPGDFGPNWSLESNVFLSIGPNNVASQSSSLAYIHNSTGDFTVIFSVWVFNTTPECRASFNDFNASAYANNSVDNFTTVTIGDAAFYMEINKHNQTSMGYPALVFVRWNVLCDIWVHSNFIGQGPLPWYKASILNIAALQLEKIDRYLAD